MELKEIQRSLPLANQLPDPILGRPGRQYLSTVPIGLLPLLPQADPAVATQAPLQTTPHVSPTNYNLGLTSLLLQRRITSRPRSPPSNHRQLLPSNEKISNPMAQRPRPNFAFLPLLDTPTSSDTNPLPSNSSSRSASPDLPSDTDQSLDPPTPSLTNASLDSSPMSRASSGSPEPSFLQLPPRHLSCGVDRYYNHRFGPRDSYFPDMDDDHSEHVVSHRPGIESSNFHSEKSTHSCDDARPVKPAELPKPTRKRNVIFVNDVEIELDDDEEESPALAPGTPDDLDSRLPKLLYATRNPSCSKNLKPPETGTSAETKAPSTSDHLMHPANNEVGGFGLHMPLRFKRRLPSIDNSSDFIYTGRS
jgi:hypothetical protein